jgi:hypothetical protein
MDRSDLYMAGVITKALALTGVTGNTRGSELTRALNHDCVLKPFSESQFLLGCHGSISSTLDSDKVSFG